jgi:ubiquinone/menaquinone biosynthesis C-methylase UbiE
MTDNDPRSFDRITDVYERFGEIINAGLVEFLRRELPGGASALDAGCGGGHLTRVLAERYDDVLGVDLSARMVELARQRTTSTAIRYRQADLTTLDPADVGRHDLVFTAYTLHHVPDLGAALRLLASLTKPGGQLLVVDIVGRREHLPANWYRRQALRTLVGDLLLFRRPVREAIELARISLHPAWLAHTMSDRPLAVPEFEEAVRAAVPGADILDLRRARMVRWTAPAAGMAPTTEPQRASDV